jgi:6-phosphogluconate dehydrogenase
VSWASNLALNIADNGYRVAVYNRTTSRTRQFADAGRSAFGPDYRGCETLEAFATAIKPPRPVIIMVKAGEAG